MAEATTIAVQPRQHAGKGAARAVRRGGRVPGVIYGTKIEPVLITVDPADLVVEMKQPGFFARVFELDMNSETHRVLARDVQFHPVNDRPMHVDFMRFSADTKLNIDVEVIFENEELSPGIKRGGVLNVVRHTIEMICSAENIPPFITVDLTGLDIGDSVHISQVDIPDDAVPTITDRDFTIATIAAPTILTIEEEEEEEVEGEEGEEIEGEEGEAVEGEGEGEGEGEEKSAEGGDASKGSAKE
jgi:large subunit ribosomal protein L25